MQMVKVIRSLSQENVPATPLENPSNATLEELSPYLFSGDLTPMGYWTSVGQMSCCLSQVHPLAGYALSGPPWSQR